MSSLTSSFNFRAFFWVPSSRACRRHPRMLRGLVSGAQYHGEWSDGRAGEDGYTGGARLGKPVPRPFIPWSCLSVCGVVDSQQLYALLPLWPVFRCFLLFCHLIWFYIFPVTSFFSEDAFFPPFSFPTILSPLFFVLSFFRRPYVSFFCWFSYILPNDLFFKDIFLGIFFDIFSLRFLETWSSASDAVRLRSLHIRPGVDSSTAPGAFVLLLGLSLQDQVLLKFRPSVISASALIVRPPEMSKDTRTHTPPTTMMSWGMPIIHAPWCHVYFHRNSLLESRRGV